MSDQLLLEGGQSAAVLETPLSTQRNADEGFLIESIVPWEGNPRKRFDPTELQQLADSISVVGVEQPIGVRFLPGADPAAKVRFQIVYGERRYRAAQMAGRTRIPAIYLGELSDFDALERAYRENHDRENISPIEEARTYERMLAAPPGMTQLALAEKLRIGQGTLSNALRLLRLPESIVDRVDHGQITKSAATALCGILDHPMKLDELVLGIDSGWSSGRIEEEVRQFKAHLAEQKRQTEVAAKPQLPFEEPAAPSVFETSVEAEAPSAPTEPIFTPEADDRGYAAKIANGDFTEEHFAESDLADADDGVVSEEDVPDEAEDDDGAIPDAPPVAEDEQGEEEATVAPAAAPVNYPLPSTPTSTSGIKNVTPGAAKPASTPSPTPPVTPTTAPTSAGPTVPATPTSMPAGTPQMSGITVLLPESWDDWLFEQDLTFLSALDTLKKFFPTPMTQKLVRVLNDEWREANPQQETMDESQALEFFLTLLAKTKGIDLAAFRGLPL